MGNLVTTTLPRFVIRKIRRFNITNRVERYLEQEKHPIAPMYEATMKQVEALMKEHPESLTEMKDKNEKLHKNLEKVYVTSEGQNPKIPSDKKLDASMDYRVFELIVEANNLDVKVKEEVPEGKYTLEDATNFLCAIQRSSNKEIALLSSCQKHKIEKESLANIAKYTKIFDVIYPSHQKRKSGIQKAVEDMVPHSLLGRDEIDLMFEALQEKEKELQAFDKHMKKLDALKKKKELESQQKKLASKN